MNKNTYTSTPNYTLRALLSLSLLTLLSCITPQQRLQERINQYPHTWSQLNLKNKELINQGKIQRGMSKEAVTISWGKPNSSKQITTPQGSFEIWTYTQQQPITSNYWSSPFYYDDYLYTRRHHRLNRRHRYHSIHPFQDINYRPIPVAHVQFLHNKVHSFATKTH